jgi:septal ring factor EnvC (AmiA/AmiB activator)
MPEPVAYGETRQRRDAVTYAQIERAATDILRAGTRPTIEGVRAALGGGSPRTILEGLNRYWRNLGNEVAERPASLRRLPAVIADLAEGLWQSALSIAMEAAQATSTEGDAQMSRLKSQLELRQHTLSQREIELDERLRSRERTVKELEDHLRAAVSMLTKRDVTVAALESRLTAAQQETENYRGRLARVVQRAVSRHQSTATKPVSKRKKPARAARRSAPRKPTRKRAGKRR